MSTTSKSWRQETAQGECDDYSPVLALFSIAGLTFLMVLFNIFHQFAGFLMVEDGELRVIPLFSPHFYATYLPMLNVLWGLALGLQAVLLVSQRWTVFTRLADLGLALLGMAILFQMATDGAGRILADPLSTFSWLVTPLLWFILLLASIDAVKKLVVLLRAA